MAYTNEEMADMHYVYGLSQGNGLEASRRYAELYPQRQHPSHRIFARLHQRLREYGSFDKRTQDCGRHREVRTPQLEEAVLNLIDENPTTSTRKIASQLNVDHMTVFRILKEQLLYPYHLQRVQALLPRDFPKRLEFCNWMLVMIERSNSQTNVVFLGTRLLIFIITTYGLMKTLTLLLKLTIKNSFLLMCGSEFLGII